MTTAPSSISRVLAGEREGPGREEISKVQIEGEDDSPFALSEGQDLVVGQAMEALLTEVDHLVSPPA